MPPASSKYHSTVIYRCFSGQHPNFFHNGGIEGPRTAVQTSLKKIYALMNLTMRYELATPQIEATTIACRDGFADTTTSADQSLNTRQGLRALPEKRLKLDKLHDGENQKNLASNE